MDEPSIGERDFKIATTVLAAIALLAIILSIVG